MIGDRLSKTNNGFTLLEILIVTVVIAFAATMTLPRFFKKKPTARWETVLDELNNLVDYARQEAISKHIVYRLHFQPERDGKYRVQVEIEQDHPEKRGQKIYQTIKSYYFNPIYTFPEPISMHAIYQHNKEQMALNKQHAYCYVIPNGLVQETVLHLVRKAEDETKQESKMTFRMSPFFGKFEMEKGFVKQKK